MRLFYFYCLKCGIFSFLSSLSFSLLFLSPLFFLSLALSLFTFSSLLFVTICFLFALPFTFYFYPLFFLYILYYTSGIWSSSSNGRPLANVSVFSFAIIHFQISFLPIVDSTNSKVVILVWVEAVKSRRHPFPEIIQTWQVYQTPDALKYNTTLLKSNKWNSNFT